MQPSKTTASNLILTWIVKIYSHENRKLWSDYNSSSKYSGFLWKKYLHVYLEDTHLQSKLFTGGSHFASWHYTCIIEHHRIRFSAFKYNHIISYTFWKREAHAPTSFLLKLRLILMYWPVANYTCFRCM